MSNAVLPKTTSYQLALGVAHAADDTKGSDIKMLDVAKVFNLSDYFILISGRSDRHVQGICNRILFEMSEKYQLKPLSIEGFDKAHWILMDYGEFIVHIFYEQEREHYNVESLWLEAEAIDWANVSIEDLEAA